MSRGGMSRAAGQNITQRRKPSTEKQVPVAAQEEWFQGPEHNVRDADVSLDTLPSSESLPEFELPELVAAVSLAGTDSQPGSDETGGLYVSALSVGDETEDDCPSCGNTDESPIPRKPRYRESKSGLPLRGFGRNSRGFH